MQGNEQAVHVEDRQCVKENIALLEAPDGMQGQAVACQIGVGEHRSLRTSGRSGGVEHAGDVVRVTVEDRHPGRDLTGGVGQGAVAPRAEGVHAGNAGNVADRLELACLPR